MQGSITKIEDLIKVYGTPVVSKVAEKYPSVATHVDAKVRLYLSAFSCQNLSPKGAGVFHPR